MLTNECLVFGEPLKVGEKRRTNPSLHEVARDSTFDSDSEGTVRGDADTGGRKGRGRGVDGKIKEPAPPVEGSKGSKGGVDGRGPWVKLVHIKRCVPVA